MPYNPNIARLKKMLQDFEVPEFHTQNLTVKCVQKHQNGTGAYVVGRNVVTRVVSGSGVAYLETGVHGDTTSIKIPANSVIRNVTAVVTKTVERAASLSIGIRAGASAGDGTIVANVSDSLIAAGTTNLAQGVGASTNSGSAISLSSNKALVQTANNYYATAGEVYVAAIATGGNINGEFGFIVEFDYLGEGN